LWARPIIEEPDKPPPAEAPLDSREHASTHEEESAGVVVPKDVPASIQSEEPAKAVQATERTIAVGRGGGLGPLDGTPCPRCGFRNEATAHFCARCGLDFAVVVQATRAPQQAAGGTATAVSPPKRRDWALIAFVAFLIAILLLVVYSPKPNPVFNAAANAFRSVAYWIAPTAGETAPYDAIQASSTGFGSPASALAGNTTATYWASAISPNFGAGTTLNFRLVDNYTLDRMLIQPGIQNGVLDVRALATPYEVRLTFFKAFPSDQDDDLVDVDAADEDTDIVGEPYIGSSACPAWKRPSPKSTTSPSADPSGTSTVSSSASPSAGPSASPTAAPTPSRTGGTSVAQATKTPLVSPSPSPDPISPTGSPSTTQITEQKCKYVKQATKVFDLPLIANLSDYTTILQFPEVEAARIQLDIVSNFRPRFSDPYSFASDLGQVAVTNVLFYPQFTPLDLFNSGVTDRTNTGSLFRLTTMTQVTPSWKHRRTTTSPNPGTRPSPYPDRPPSTSRNRLPVLVRTTSTTTPMAKARMAEALTMTPKLTSPRQPRFVVVTRTRGGSCGRDR
jgi:hypothetical protein